jgi:diacylglycerol kinase (ATP)
MTDVAVVAHSRKNFGGGLPELRKVLAEQGVTDPIWHEVTKSRFAPEYARRAVAQGADVLFVWGGDGTVQRCIDAVAGTSVAVAILPAGTANLLAMNLRIPDDLTEAVRVGMHGDRRRLDTGSVNGEHFTVMAGAGFDARMISDAGRGRKNRLGRAAYLSAGASNLSARRAKATIKVDGRHFFGGKVSCVLAGNVGKILGGVEAFPAAQPDDGLLELGLVTAKNPAEWTRTFARLALGHAENSPFVEVARGRKFKIRFDRKVLYELDGGARSAVRELRIKVRPGSITICVPAELRCRRVLSVASAAASSRFSRSLSRRWSSPSCFSWCACNGRHWSPLTTVPLPISTAWSRTTPRSSRSLRR